MNKSKPIPNIKPTKFSKPERCDYASPTAIWIRFGATLLTLLFSIWLLPSRAETPNESTSDQLPPLAPAIVREAPTPSPDPQPKLPEPSGPPEGEMPPTAPPINPPSTLFEPTSTQQFFNLHAQKVDLGVQQEGYRLMRPNQDSINNTTQFASATNNGLNGSTQQTGSNKRLLTQVELKKLAAHDVVLLIDRSASMSAMDCPNGSFGKGMGILPSLLGIPLMTTSRWNWCLQQTSELSQQTQQIYAQGITVVLFSSGFITFPNVTLDRLQSLFRQNSPAGGTNLAPALATQIGEYFRRREYARGNVKPVVIGIITDGCPSNRAAVKEAIIEATHLMKNPQEVTIIFFLIGGMDFAGERFVHALSNNLQNQGAKFDIVREVTFSQLQQIGLAKAIVENLQ